MRKNLFFIALLLGASVLTFGQSNIEPNLVSKVSDTIKDLNIDGELIINNKSYYHSVIRLGKNFNDNIFSDNSSNKFYGGGIFFRVHNENVFNKYIDALLINDNGNIGIGIKPETKLEVDGDISARGYSSIGFNTYDAFDYKNQKVAHYGLTRIGNFVSLSGWDGLRFLSGGNQKMIINSLGRVGIGTDIPDEKLTVKGKIHAEEVIVDLNVPADYVFQKYYTGKSDLKTDYVFPKLNEIETFVKENNHLPDMPSAKEIQENGLKIGEMNNLLLQKIEELTLYIIQQEKEINKMKQDIKLLKNE